MQVIHIFVWRHFNGTNTKIISLILCVIDEAVSMICVDNLRVEVRIVRKNLLSRNIKHCRCCTITIRRSVHMDSASKERLMDVDVW